MKKSKITALLLTTVLLLSSCSTATVESVAETEQETVAQTQAVEATETVNIPDTVTTDYSGMTAEEIVATLTLEQKAAQMVQVSYYNIDSDIMNDMDYGSAFHHLGMVPELNQYEWQAVTDEFQEAAINSAAGIPNIFGQDNVHGMNSVSGGVIFPQNINIGAANDPELTEEYGAIVGSEMILTGMIWNFAPVVTNNVDPRWGRTYECFSSDIALCDELATAYIAGQLSEGAIVCPKHFFCEGYVVYGSGEISEGVDRLIDRGDSEPTQEQIEACLAVYEHMVELGVQTIMISHTSMWGTKMHENAEYIQILKNDFGFEGFIISDWDALEKCSGADLYENVVLSVNAGIDMLMEPTHYDECIECIIEAVNNGDITEERIDDAVTRIIRVKLEAGLFDDPFLDNFEPTYEFNSDRSHEVARQLAAESVVPFQLGEYSTIEPGMRVLVMGPAADDTGVLCGGWTYAWLGATDAEFGDRVVEDGVTILDGLEAAADEIGFTVVTDPDEAFDCDLIVLCLGENPYAEWYGDTESLSITGGDQVLSENSIYIDIARASGVPTMTLIVSGRNMIVDNYLDDWDSCYFCYLPGSEGGNGIADVITGQVEATGTLPMPYYSSEDDIASGNFVYDVGWSAAN